MITNKIVNKSIVLICVFKRRYRLKTGLVVVACKIVEATKQILIVAAVHYRKLVLLV